MNRQQQAVADFGCLLLLIVVYVVVAWALTWGWLRVG